MTLEELLDFYEFDLITNPDNTFALYDRQHGNIEQETFNSHQEILDRMDAYHIDYIIDPLLDNIFYLTNEDLQDMTWSSLYHWCIDHIDQLADCEWDIHALGLITQEEEET